ncbi:MAG: class II fumarate hydratase, partial [Myxococcota bacterium]
SPLVFHDNLWHANVVLSRCIVSFQDEARKQSDSMEPVEASSKAQWGAQTQRALQHFYPGARVPLQLIYCYAHIKQAAAKSNSALGVLQQQQCHFIVQAAQEIIQGKWDDQFPLSVWQSGSGTQTNMNVNEVIANRANALARDEKKQCEPIHPNNHVNCGQSTNDTFPTAMALACCVQVRGLQNVVDAVIKCLVQQAKQHNQLIKMGRTHLQDAVPITFGQELQTFADQLQRAMHNVQQSTDRCRTLPLGGTAVGTGLNAHPQFASAVVKQLSKQLQQEFFPCANPCVFMAAHDEFVGVAGSLCCLATCLNKIANDIRWLSSGPRGGLGEINIPANEPGSSIMPGKVNPSQCEALSMMCAHVMGLHTAITFAASQGSFQLNTYKPLIAYNVLSGMQLLTNGLHHFHRYCLQDLKPNRQRMNQLAQHSLMLATALAPTLGYERTAEAVKCAQEANKSLREVVVDLGWMNEQEFDSCVDLQQMAQCNIQLP